MRGCAGAATLNNKCHRLRSVQYLVPPGSCERGEARCSNSRSRELRAHKGSIGAPLDFIAPVKRFRAMAVIASAAKQSILSLRGEMDCFAALAMTISRHACKSRDAKRPSRYIYLPPLRGRGERRVPVAPAVSCAMIVVERTRVTTSTPESPGIPARNGFNGFLGALPGDRALLPPSSANMVCLRPVGPTKPPRT
jgi:hypothetical protein